jgi:hypothetical protein
MDETATVLCSECAFLILEEKQTMNKVWPAFLWGVLTNGVADCWSFWYWSVVVCTFR